MDMNDRALRRITLDIGEKKGALTRNSGFVITAASEVMAMMALATSIQDLRRRLDAIVVGVSRSGKPVRAADLGATGAMMALLTEAIMPNLVADHRRHAGHGAHRAVRQYRARHQQRDFPQYGNPAGRLRGE